MTNSSVAVQCQSISILILLVFFMCKTTGSLDRAETPEQIAFLQKSGCLGPCPVYEISVFSNRTYAFKGISNVPVIGEQKDTLTDEEFDNIKSAILNSGFLQLDSHYMEPVVDVAYTSISIRNKGKTNRVSCNTDPPMAFIQMEKTLTAPASTRAWLKTKNLDSISGINMEWIIELLDVNSAVELEKKYPDLGLQLIKRIAPTLSYFLYQIKTPGDLSVDELRELLLKDPLVKAAELNRKLKPRSEPTGQNK